MGRASVRKRAGEKPGEVQEKPYERIWDSASGEIRYSFKN